MARAHALEARGYIHRELLREETHSSFATPPITEDAALPDSRQHRGPHPDDPQLFAAELVPDLRRAIVDLNWLLTRGYPSASALKLVGDRYGLMSRQRIALGRCACADAQRDRRRRHQVSRDDLRDQSLWIDGYNVLISLEAALSGGVILLASDGCYRDLANMHGSYRKAAETLPALRIIGELLEGWGAADVHWLLDQPVSNSGRLKTLLRELAHERTWPWEVELVPDPDALLRQATQIVASADSQVIDVAPRWFNLAREAITCRIPQAWIVDLSG